jgi:hypothetical protein
MLNSKLIDRHLLIDHLGFEYEFRPPLLIIISTQVLLDQIT